MHRTAKSTSPDIRDHVQLPTSAGHDGAQVLTPGALGFVVDLERRFARPRQLLLAARAERASQLAAGGRLDFPPASSPARADTSWRVPAPAPDLIDRRVEIATPPLNERRASLALWSGAQVWVADLEDALSPTWANVLRGHAVLRAAAVGELSVGPPVLPADQEAAIVVRPRGWHQEERHVTIDGAPVSASLFDFGLYFFHCARGRLKAGSGPYFYLPKLEGAADAALWNDVFDYAEDVLGLDRGIIRSTVLIEDVAAAFETEEILRALGPHAAGLTAGRWDYLFSYVRAFRTRPDRVLPDRQTVTMTAPFLHAYTEVLIDSCHRRGAHAIGGVSAVLPDRHDPRTTARAVAAVLSDKRREAAEGFDGAWVVHPDLVEPCRRAFDEVLSGRPHQIGLLGTRPEPDAQALVRLDGTGGRRTLAGLHSNIAVCVRYLDRWLRGQGTASIGGLMEGAATVEIARSQIWQWIRHAVVLEDGTQVTRALAAEILQAECARLAAERDAADGGGVHPQGAPGALSEARRLVQEIALCEDYPDFMTTPGYDALLALEDRASALAPGQPPEPKR